MATPRHLNNAPIHEALIDLRVRLAPDFDHEILKNAHEMVKEDYPKSETRLRGQVEFALAPDGTTTQKMAERGVHGYFFKTEDEKRLVQFRLDGFTYNWLRPYETWERFRDEARRLWEIYATLAKPLGITRVAVRYINRLSLPLPVNDFEEYLTAAPRVPDALPQGVGSFLTRVVINEPRKGFTGIIIQALEGIVDPGTITILLDIDASKETDFDADGVGAWRTVEELRNFKNDIFFRSVTDKTLSHNFMTDALAIGNFRGLRAGRGGTAVSAASQALDKILVGVLEHLNAPATQSEPLRGVLANLDELYERCSQPGWDGYDAMPITEDTYNEARELIALLPALCPPPDATPDPSGHVSFEWYRSPRKVLVVSVNGTKMLTFARLLGARKMSGAEPYDKSLPQSIVDSLARLYPQ
ncbi:MAG: hypothetical protein A3G24_02805 [Betaproteobacteria bacterium RIFCSPLOWO2_12_FULL_62_13]|nr:MAG: hypothetical protein A3G24_02805 [Betaproteobacteria bacterium RIFCSPLOWO2_12_FULL_62_13]